MKDAEEERAHFGAAFKPLEACKKRQEDILDDVLSLGRLEAHAARNAIQAPRVVIDHRRERGGIAPPQTIEEFWIAGHALHVTPRPEDRTPARSSGAAAACRRPRP